MRILFLLTYYYPHWTGLTQYARRLAEGLVKKDFDVKILTTIHEKGLKNEEIINRVRVSRKPILFRLSRTLVSPQFIGAFWKEIKSCDQIVIYLPFAEVVLAAIIGKIFKKRVYLVHNGDLKLPKGFINRVIEKFYYFSTEVAIIVCDKIIIQTEDYGNSSNLLLKYKNKWRVILPLFEERHISSIDTSKLKTKLFSNKKYTVGFAGRFVEEKGFDILLKAIPIVLHQLPNTQFIFAGETKITYEDFFQQTKKLVDRIKASLIIFGRLEESEMPSFYKLCDVFVISSRSDCFPSVGVEAMLSGVPLVVTDIPGARQIVRMSGMGVLVRPQDPYDLANGIIEVLLHRRKYIKPQKTINNIFNYQKTLREYENLII